MSYRINSNNIVVSSGAPQTNFKSSVISYQNILPDSAIIGSSEDSNYPFFNLYDHSDITKYSSHHSGNGSIQITFSQTRDMPIDYFGMCAHNSSNSDLRGKLEVFEAGEWHTVCEFRPSTTDKVVYEVFDKRYSAIQRLTLNFSSKFYIGYMSLGESMRFETSSDIGYIPAKFNRITEVKDFIPQNNNFTLNRYTNNGYETQGTISNVSMSLIDEHYEALQDHVMQGKTLFFCNDISNMRDVIWGRQDIKSFGNFSYTSSDRTSFSFKIKGYI